MATPRKNWFKVPDSVAFDDLSNDELACLIRLQAYMNTRWARDGKSESERGRCSISPAIAKQITGKHRADVAATSLRHLADIASISVRYDGEVASIEWPKYAEFQETTSRETPPPSPISKTSPSQDFTNKKEEKREIATASRSTRSPRSAPAAFPGSMTGSDWDALGRKHGVDPSQLLEIAADWAGEKDRGYTAAGWSKAINRALRDRWEWTRSLFAVPGRSDLQSRETPAQARERHTFEAARRVAERITHDPIQLAIVAQTKGAA